MAYKIKDLGFWESYRPTVFPPGVPEIAMFCRRVSDGVDWYQLVRNPDVWNPNAVYVTGLPGRDGLLAQSINRIPQHLFPQSCQLLEVEGVPLDDDKPHRLFEGKIIDIVAGTFSDLQPGPVESVTGAQAKGALFQAGLLGYVEAIVRNHPYEMVRIFYNSANNWERANPYVQAIGLELGLSDAAFDKLFTDAAKL